MKNSPLMLAFISFPLWAQNHNLENGQGYIVPEGKSWIIENVPIGECRVCTADIYIKGVLSRVEVNGVSFYGDLEFSFTNNTNGPVKLYAGTEIWLGDSRKSLKVTEHGQ